MLKRYTAMILCLMLLCASARAETLVKKWPQTGEPFGEDVETMRVIVMGIGAKDSFLIQCGGENMLIDSGTYSAAAKVYERLVALAAEKEVKNSIILWPLRVAVSGKASTPGGATELCALLGKDESLTRIERGIAMLSQAQ